MAQGIINVHWLYALHCVYLITNGYEIQFLLYCINRAVSKYLMNLCELLLHVSAKISHIEANFRYGTCLEKDARWSLVHLREGYLLPTSKNKL